MSNMRICILLAGRNDSRIDPSMPGFFQLFQALFSRCGGGSGIQLSERAVLDGEFPMDVHEFDGYLITGSPVSVYEDLPWVPRLMAFIRSAHTARLPLGGICFGHQALAHALGGQVAQSPKGWGAGIRTVPILSRTAWMDDGPAACDLVYMHKDQVVALPEGSQLIMGDDFCPIAAFSLGNGVFGIQGHPEFTNQLALELVNLRAEKIGHTKAEAARESLKHPHHGDRAGKWLVDFFLRYRNGRGC